MGFRTVVDKSVFVTAGNGALGGENADSVPGTTGSSVSKGLTGTGAGGGGGRLPKLIILGRASKRARTGDVTTTAVVAVESVTNANDEASGFLVFPGGEPSPSEFLSEPGDAALAVGEAGATKKSLGGKRRGRFTCCAPTSSIEAGRCTTGESGLRGD
jgi:hypothetical protein